MLSQVYLRDLIWDQPCCIGLLKSIADICADDSIISSNSKRFEQLTSTLSEDLNTIDHWYNLNNMAINVTKSKVMLVNSKHNHRTFLVYHIKLLYICFKF